MHKSQKILMLLGALLFVCSFSHAQEDYKRWLKEEQDKYKEFKDERDKAFIEFLKREWRNFQLFKGLVPDDTPKPENVPTALSQEIPEDQIPETPVIIREIRIPEEAEVKSAESMAVFLSKFKKEGKPLAFDFFDVPLEVHYDDEIIKADLVNPINEDMISRFWGDLSKTEYVTLLDQSHRLKKKMELNDWGYCLLVNEIAEKLYPGSKNNRNLFIWFMLSKSGYDSRVGYDEKQTYLLLPSQNTIYRAPFFILNEKRYYVITFDNRAQGAKSIYT